MLNEKGKINNLGCFVAIIVMTVIFSIPQIALHVFYDGDTTENCNNINNENLFVPDKLQKLFASATEYIQREDVERLARENGLYFDIETFGGSWEETISYKVAFNYSDAQHWYSGGGDYVEFIFNNFSHQKLIEVNYYNQQHSATAEFNPPRSYHYSYYDLKEGRVRYSCRDSWDAIAKVLAHNR